MSNILPQNDPVATALIGSVDAVIGLLEQPAPHDPTSRRHGIAHLRDRVEWHAETLRDHRKRIEEHVAEAERLEAECDQIEAIIAELRADVAILGGTA